MNVYIAKHSSPFRDAFGEKTQWIVELVTATSRNDAETLLKKAYCNTDTKDWTIQLVSTAIAGTAPIANFIRD